MSATESEKSAWEEPLYADQIFVPTTVWPDGPDFTYQSSGEWPLSFGSKESSQGEAGELPLFLYVPEEEEWRGEAEKEEEEEEEEDEEEVVADKKDRGKGKGRKKSPEDGKSKSLFVHSFPSQFPDVTKTRHSAFGSIFIKTSADIPLLRSIGDSSYIRLSSLLESFDKIIKDANTDAERRRLTANFKDALQKSLEAHGIRKTYSDGSVHWDIYPITQNYLFSVQMKDRLHQTRDLTRLEERIVEGPVRELKLPFSWPTKSIWSGYWDSLGMTSTGIYSMPHGVSYFGKMQDGMFHDTNATLTYPNKFKALNCVFEKGKLLSCQFQFPDLLVYEDDWKYCKFPDRRFWIEVQNGLKSAKIAEKTQVHPARTIPPGCYDTGDGFYNPKTLMLETPTGKLLRVPVCEEDLWIKKYCRKGFFEYSEFRPDLFEDWFDYDQNKIQSILNYQSAFRAGKITYEELQQFYADMDLLPSFSPYKKKKTKEEIEKENIRKSIPEPKFLRMKKLKKYQGHQINEKIEENPEASEERSESKSQIAQDETSVQKKNFSKISFSGSKHKSEVSDSRSEPGKRKIPEKYLQYRPLLKLPFEMGPREAKKKKCVPRTSSSASSSEELLPAEDDDMFLQLLEKKNLQKYMKSIILDVVSGFLEKERERHRKRFVWGRKIPKVKSEDRDKEALKVLKNLFDSIPDTDEFCDSDPKKTCDLKELAKDKHNMLKYWGKRILLLDFDEEVKEVEEKQGMKCDLTINAEAELLFAPFLKSDD